MIKINVIYVEKNITQEMVYGIIKKNVIMKIKYWKKNKQILAKKLHLN